MKKLNVFLMSLLILLAGCKETQTALPAQPAYSKPHAPVEMTFSQSAKASTGNDLSVEVVLTTTKDVDDLEVSVTADNNLLLLDYPHLRHLGAQHRQQTQVLKISCQPQQDGLYYLYVAATVVVKGQPQTRSFPIPVYVGEVNASQQLKATGVVEQDANGEAIISMPAQQNLRPAK
ncbi:MAG: hypothetical protein HYZ31_13505 [Gammaproteobacteria bacterium]|nr:hypothetical protein [Gammaproteobacteria bacterium]